MNPNRGALFARLLLIVIALLALGADWPQWRGPNRDSVWPETDLPDAFPAGGPKRRWQRPVGSGYGGIAATGGRVYLLDRRKTPREVERVVCLDAATGQDVWTRAYDVTYGNLDYGNGPRATPTVSDGRVYAYGALGYLHCLDAKTGDVVWARDLTKDFNGKVPTWGHACSPLVHDGRVVVQAGGRPDACLVALDAATGKEVWRALGDRAGYSSPVLLDVGTTKQLLYWSAEHLSGLDPATGKVLWQTPHATNYDVTISDPIIHKGVVVVSDYWEGSLAVRLDAAGRSPTRVWGGRKPLSLLMATPLTRDGFAYALDRHNGLKCLEIETGAVKWEGEHVTPRGQNPHASFVWAGDKAVILTSKGELVLAKLAPSGYKELAKAKIVGDTWAHPGFLDGAVFARNDEEIVCVSLKEETPRRP